MSNHVDHATFHIPEAEVVEGRRFSAGIWLKLKTGKIRWDVTCFISDIDATGLKSGDKVETWGALSWRKPKPPQNGEPEGPWTLQMVARKIDVRGISGAVPKGTPAPADDDKFDGDLPF